MTSIGTCGGEGEGGGDGGGGQLLDRPVVESDSGAPRVASAIVADTRPLPLRSTTLSPYQAPHKLGLPTTPPQGSANHSVIRASISAALHAMLWIAT